MGIRGLANSVLHQLRHCTITERIVINAAEVVDTACHCITFRFWGPGLCLRAMHWQMTRRHPAILEDTKP